MSSHPLPASAGPSVGGQRPYGGRVAVDVNELFTTEPAAFVAARNALAKALRAEGRKEDAAAVAALRRPTVPDWALNSVAVREPDVVEAAVAAADHLREVQAAALGDPSTADDLRDAMAHTRQAAAGLRKAAEGVLRAAGRPSGDVNALTTRLNQTMVHPGLLAQLQAGRLGTEEVAALDPFGGTAAPVAPRPSRPPAPAPKPKPAPPSRVADAAAADRAERQARRAAEVRARRREQASARVEQAEDAVDEARAGVRNAAVAVKEANAALDRARRAEASAQSRLEKAEAHRDEAAARLAAVDDD
jgi:hypothetical protein